MPKVFVPDEEHDRTALLAFEAQSSQCADARRALNVVIASKLACLECYEIERTTHNRLLVEELRVDNDRMHLLMQIHQATRKETKYQTPANRDYGRRVSPVHAL